MPFNGCCSAGKAHAEALVKRNHLGMGCKRPGLQVVVADRLGQPPGN